MRIADLVGKRVAVWGFGREGHAAIRAIRRHWPDLPLTLFCRAGEADDLAAELELRTTPPDAAVLTTFDVVVKSPGISIYRPELIAARERGTVFTSGTALWFGDNPAARVVAVTGTKGKSTTTAMLAHLARALDVRTALAGNIGLPLLDLDGQQADLWAIELSSFQTGEAGPVDVGVVTSLYEEHLDWHGTVERYWADKLKLADVARTLLVNATQSNLMTLTARHPRRELFGVAAGWRVAGGWICRGVERVVAASDVHAPGAHNALNACAALAALELAGFDARAAAPALASFTPLPHRLQILGRRDGLRWVNDSISTTPEATLAALRALAWDDVVPIVGGFDRGLDWSHFAADMHAHRPRAIVTQGANGPRIAAALRAAGIACPLVEAADFDAAVAAAKRLAAPAGVVLLSPGAPSFDAFANYAARGRRFAALAGFDAAAITDIAGLGID